jgi:preprotein translocase subunit YajC
VTRASLPNRRNRGRSVDFPLVQDFTPVLFLVGIAVLFWLLLVRPQSRRQRELAHMQSTLEMGDEVMLTSGVFGTVRGLDEDVAQVEIADGVTIRVARGAIGRVVRDDAAPAEEDAGPADAAHTDHGEAPEEN